MADDVTLDSLAPTPSTPAAPAAPPTQPSSAAAPPASAAPVATPVAPAQPPPDPTAALLRSLGYQSPEELQRDLAFTRRFRAEADRVRQQQIEADPNRQAAQRRGEALRGLVAEGYSPEVADALQTLPEIQQFLDAQRVEAANHDLDSCLSDLGIKFDGSKEAQGLRQHFEDAIADRLNGNRALNARYFASPTERRAVIRELVEAEEKRINHALSLQGALTLREHAARSARTPRGLRSAASLPPVREEKPTATDPTLRRREGNAIASRQLDDIWNHTRA